MVIQARFGAAQTGVGYQFYSSTGTLLGTRVTSGIAAGPETGLYIADATVPAGAVGVYWSTDDEEASEDLRDAAPYVADAVWDEPLTGASHNLPTSAGRRLRQLTTTVIHEGTAVSGGTNGNQIQLDGDASTVDDTYDPALIAITGGAGVGQCRMILQYEGLTRTATVDRNWKIIPDDTSEFIILADSGREHVNEGLAQGGTSDTITLNALAKDADNSYVGQTVFIRSGTGDDQARMVIAYNGATRVATVERGWDTIPDTTSAYVMLPNHIHLTTEIADAILRRGVVHVENEADAHSLAAIILATLESAISGNKLTIRKTTGATFTTKTLTSNPNADPIVSIT